MEHATVCPNAEMTQKKKQGSPERQSESQVLGQMKGQPLSSTDTEPSTDQSRCSPWASLSGSAYSRSHSKPVSVTSVSLMMHKLYIR
ncbi:hypothetical protein NQZ68_016235 [Dissostichus eleginoides]|nr:hypothetical protein NQZ68_016235 [Dissostichus eleginoides]